MTCPENTSKACEFRGGHYTKKKMDRVKLEVVKVKGGIHWAQKATMPASHTHSGNIEVRYRGFMYKLEAITNLREWEHIRDVGLDAGDFARDFYHNFHTAEQLHIQEV